MVNLMQGDCLELMKSIPDKSVDMILCDLPYGITNCKWDKVIPFELLWEQYNRIVKNHSVIALFGSEPFSSDLRMSNIKNFKYDWIWDKVSGAGFLNAHKRPLKQHEVISIFSIGKPVYLPQMETRGRPREKGHGRKENNNDYIYGNYNSVYKHNNTYYPKSILRFTNAIQKDKLHPTQKPVALLEYLIKTYTNEGETVLDNCMGSGSTGVACVNTGRNFIGMELDKMYFNIAKTRIEQIENLSNSAL